MPQDATTKHALALTASEREFLLGLLQHKLKAFSREYEEMLNTAKLGGGAGLSQSNNEMLLSQQKLVMTVQEICTKLAQP